MKLSVDIEWETTAATKITKPTYNFVWFEKIKKKERLEEIWVINLPRIWRKVA